MITPNVHIEYSIFLITLKELVSKGTVVQAYWGREKFLFFN